MFPKGIGKDITEYVENVNVDVLSIDYNIDLAWALENINNGIILQGNLDPKVLSKGGKELEEQAIKIKNAVGIKQHIFNVGHGLLPETPIDNVHKFIKILKGK